MNSIRGLTLAVVGGLLLAGCATLDTSVPRTVSHAGQIDIHASRIGRAFAQGLAQHPGEAASLLLDEGPVALLQRAMLADYADHTIDLQTYIYEDDDAGIVLMERLFRAAERGVRVRVLIDDNGLASDSVLPLVLAEHPNIEVRIFNPFHWRARWSRPFQYVFEFRRLNRRMHNKLFIVDNTALIVGGRNVGGNYFDQDTEANFTDVDALLVGQVAREGSTSFDQYWNSEFAIPAEAVPQPLDDDARKRLLENYRERLGRFESRRSNYEVVRDRFFRALEAHKIPALWGTAHIVADDPAKVDPHAEGVDSPVVEALREEWRNARHEILVSSAYFVPGRRGTELMTDTVRDGVPVTVLTNSLASNDVAIVHAGYAKYRRKLLEGGVELHEFQLFGDTQVRSREPSSAASLHSKTIVFDRQHAWIGSFNLDPRSIELNTEVVAVVDSASLAEALAEKIREDMGPDRSWRVILARDSAGHERLEWHGIRDGREVVLYSEPDASRLKRFGVKLFKWLPGLDRLL